ncbi:heavy metal translocating P-type ATPase [Thalassotalea aquiviva]|uniref:heavy metal translocating P-type ATPase n=1 Tax=Thalassotalea aquiviva TaxID=3242415 RepID=UPI00352B4685
MNGCFHCGESIPPGLKLFVNIDDKDQPMCCYGCQAVAQAIVENDLQDYYRFRTEKNKKVDEVIPQALLEQPSGNDFINDESLQSEFTHDAEQGRETILSIDGMACAACAWLIEKQVQKQPGVVKIQVNATSQRATVCWQPDTVQLSDILNLIQKIGYQALPFKANLNEQKNEQQAKAFIRRLGVSGILTMQVMMVAFGLYFGAFSDLAEHNLTYLRGTSFVLTLPIVTYGALPFHIGAYKALKAKHLSMDVPVSIAIILAFIASSYATFTQSGEVYFESVSMFTFLLLIGKFLEFRARARAAEVSANLLKLMPLTATKLVQGCEQIVSAKSLVALDQVSIKPGETIAGDGVIVDGNSSINEAMLTGEHDPIDKSIGDAVFAGTVNGDGNLVVEISKPNAESFLTNLIRLSESAQAYKPKIAKLSDRIAQYFVALVLVTSSATALYWYQTEPQDAFWIALSVLVATCPCALSLATPTALTCGTISLNRQGILIKNAHVLETVPKLNRVAFDKTGTLTQGQFSLDRLVREPNFEQFSDNDILAIASTLESRSEHPIAKAFLSYRDHSVAIENIKVIPGCGIEGKYQGQTILIGKFEWVKNFAKVNSAYDDAQCILILNGQCVAAFYLKDSIRDDAVLVLETLKQHQIEPMLISGDSKKGVDVFLQQLPINDAHSACSAQDKLNIIEQQQRQGNHLAMVGDGVNDSPVFAAAHVSIAMGSGTEIAKSGADVILLNNKLSSILALCQISDKTNRIIRQNFGWAFAYNAIVLPLAVAGFITPYLAVLGMSASSIIVVSNSLRLLK